MNQDQRYDLLSQIYDKLAAQVTDVNELPVLRDYMAECEVLDEAELLAELADCENSYSLYRENYA